MTLLEQYKREIDALNAAINKLMADPASTQSVSTPNGGSFSASYFDLEKLERMRDRAVSRYVALYKAENGESDISLRYPIYCGG